MAEPQTQKHTNLDQTPTLSHSPSICAADPPIPTASTAVEDPDCVRESKRRKNCPTALDKLEESAPSLDPSFSFTFETKSGGFAPEITPKFGSFNLIVEEAEKDNRDQQSEKIAKDEEIKEEEEEEDGTVKDEENVKGDEAVVEDGGLRGAIEEEEEEEATDLDLVQPKHD